MRVAELPVTDRPREKMLRQGPEALSDAELVAILLRTGTRGEGVLDLASSWLKEVGGLEELATIDVGQIRRRKGVGLAKATVLAAALELGRRLARRRLEGRPLLERPEAVADFLTPSYGSSRVEVFGCLTLDSRHRLVRTHVLHRGGRAHAAVEPAEVFHRAIIDNANGIIIWHTHPSGDPAPSEDDVDLTRRLVQGGKLLGIGVLDHIVIARCGHVSFRQRGILPLR